MTRCAGCGEAIECACPRVEPAAERALSALRHIARMRVTLAARDAALAELELVLLQKVEPNRESVADEKMMSAAVERCLRWLEVK